MHTELGIRVVDGEPGMLENAVTDLKGIGGVLDTTAGELSGSAQPQGWLGSAAVMYGERCVTQGSAAQAGGHAMTMAAGHLSTLAGELRDARRKGRQAVDDAREAKARAEREHTAATRAQQQADAGWISAAASARRASTSEAAGVPAAAERDAQSQAETAAGNAEREAGEHRRAAQRAEDDLRDAQERGNRAADHYDDAARRAAAAIGSLAEYAPQVTSVNGVPVASVGGPGKAPGVAPLPPPKPAPKPEEHHGGIGGLIHGALDAAGFVPVVGAAADGANALYYAADGDEVNAAFSAAAAVPIVGDAAAAGKLVYKGSKAIKAAEEADEGLEVARDVSKYSRPAGYRKGVRDEVWTGAKDPVTGEVRDPVSSQVMNREDPWDMGHKPGYEFRKHQDSAAEREITRGQFLDEHNDPSHYRPELPSSNRRHAGEDLTDTWLGP